MSVGYPPVWPCRLGELRLMAGRIMEMRQALRDGLEKEGQWM